MKGGYGGTNNSARFLYEKAAYALRTALTNTTSLPTEIMKEYLSSTTLMVNASTSQDPLTDEDIMKAQKMITDDQTMFFEALMKTQEAKVALAEKEAEYQEQKIEYAEKIKDIDEQIADLTQRVAMAQGEVKAAEAAYTTVSTAITGSLTVQAPRSGTISTILKKPGEFAEPGMPLASVSAGKNQERFVRFRIPGNSIPPHTGAMLRVVRPGFANNSKQAKLLGVGTSLDATGSYLADAMLQDAPDWPIHASVRVLASTNDTPVIRIPLAAVAWNEDNGAYVWTVDADRTLHIQIIVTGKTLDDTIEVQEGLVHGDTYVVKILPELEEGMNIGALELSIPSSQNQEPSPQENNGGGGHGHEE